MRPSAAYIKPENGGANAPPQIIFAKIELRSFLLRRCLFSGNGVFAFVKKLRFYKKEN